MQNYQDFMKKAHGALILERENEIIMELRATREYLNQKIDTNHEEINARFDAIENRFDGIEKMLKEILAK